MKRLYTLLIFILVSNLDADQISFQFNNDLFAGTDRHYSNGWALSWMDDTYEHEVTDATSYYSRFILNTFDVLSIYGLDKSKNYNTGVSLAQAIITPEDISISTAQYNDFPYAAYLGMSLYVFEWSDNSFKEYRINFGVIGKDAGGETVQNGFHSLIGNEDAKGWDTQLETHYSVNALLQYGEISWERNRKNSLSMDWFNHFGVELGNFNTNAFFGTVFRIGDNYGRSFNVHSPLLNEEASMVQLNKRNNNFGWSISAGISGSLSAYSYIVDKARDEGYSFDKKIFHGSTYIGSDFFYQNHKLSIFYKAPTTYSAQQNSRDLFGGIIYVYSF